MREAGRGGLPHGGGKTVLVSRLIPEKGHELFSSMREKIGGKKKRTRRTDRDAYASYIFIHLVNRLTRHPYPIYLPGLHISKLSSQKCERCLTMASILASKTIFTDEYVKILEKHIWIYSQQYSRDCYNCAKLAGS